MIKENVLGKMGMLLMAILVIGLVGAVIYEHYGGSLSSGNFSDSLYNSTGNYVYLNWTDATNTSYVESGIYISELIDFSYVTESHNIKWSGEHSSCPEGMAYIDKFGGYCIDKYEAYPRNSDGSDATPPESAGDTDTLIAAGGKAGSALNKTVWVYINQTEARTACSNAGKHLCTDLEWLGAANIQRQVYDLATDLAVSPYYCVTGSDTYCLNNSPGDGEACQTGYYSGGVSGCYSAEGVYDMVGNVYEWTNETVTVIKTCNSGADGWCYPSASGDRQTATYSDTAKYGNDGVYFLAGTNAGRAVRRGGDWGNGASAGPFCAGLHNAPAGTYSPVGFRCCSS